MTALLLVAFAASAAAGGVLLAINTAQRPASAGTIYWRGILAGLLVATGAIAGIAGISDYRESRERPAAPQTPATPDPDANSIGGIDTEKLGAQVYAAYASEGERTYKRRHGQYTESVAELRRAQPELDSALKRDRSAGIALKLRGDGVAITARAGSRSYTQRLK